MAGNGLFADARVHIHEADLIGAERIDGLMEVYGLTGASRASSRRSSSRSSTTRRARTPTASPTATCSTSAAA